METETDLLARARRFEQRALGGIYDRYSPDLYRYAMRLLGDADLAEECVAETFSRLLHALHSGGGPRLHLRAYLYQVSHNWITDYYRRRPPPPLPFEACLDAESGQEPSDTVERRLDGERLRTALRLLTPEQRQVVALKFLEGWQNEEIAEALGKTVGAVKSLQHRGLASLRRILASEETGS
ncbi:MAG: sigma-70 family RNA polymerase sigma factor [Anaerolineae bacterium]|nr:sigma-70 family RNA polymerase sigma factor [Anaerolineae bacterium]NIN97124.1 sigma-70 family RNA polymerase sigma factor [Anaerolineae bacterium]NIQ80097.1 sigma-70 family RNA polymerase sigma factor [Anaerolineae bacterium]